MTRSGGPVAGVLLAGGLARRMGGGDKPLKTLGGRPILDLVVERAQPQVDTLILNANGDPARFSGYGLEVVSDVIEGFAGPLAGVLSGMEWVRDHMPDSRWLVSFATDAPFFPDDMVAQLIAAVEANDADMACASSHERTHPVFALWPVALAEGLRAAMVDEDMRKIDRWTARYTISHVDFADISPEDGGAGMDPFFNINRPDDLAGAQRWLDTGAGVTEGRAQS